MKSYELIIDDDTEGIDAISLVDRPAIEENFIELSKDVPYTFQEVSKGIVTVPALINTVQSIALNYADDEDVDHASGGLTTRDSITRKISEIH